jgi:hypothetical protein
MIITTVQVVVLLCYVPKIITPSTLLNDITPFCFTPPVNDLNIYLYHHACTSALNQIIQYIMDMVIIATA